MTAWTETTCHDALLHDLLFQYAYGVKPNQYVYIVYKENTCIYVGQTAQNVIDRLWRHIKSESDLGLWIKDHNPIVDVRCKFIVISGDLSAAERYYISRNDPELNIVRYKSGLTLPPTQFAAVQSLDLALIEAMQREKMQEERRKDNEALDRLYARAYRDPNHPDLRPV